MVHYIAACLENKKCLFKQRDRYDEKHDPKHSNKLNILSLYLVISLMFLLLSAHLNLENFLKYFIHVWICFQEWFIFQNICAFHFSNRRPDWYKVSMVLSVLLLYAVPGAPRCFNHWCFVPSLPVFLWT